MSQQTTTKKEYKFVKDSPVAKFYYKGDHTHLIRRIIVIIESNEKLITGYELREGSCVRQFKDAPIKSFRKDRIAKVKELDQRRRIVSVLNPSKTTLKRFPLNELIRNGA
jgi:hypothetical protein